jgi:hypothetical protein
MRCQCELEGAAECTRAEGKFKEAMRHTGLPRAYLHEHPCVQKGIRAKFILAAREGDAQVALLQASGLCDYMIVASGDSDMVVQAAITAAATRSIRPP